MVMCGSKNGHQRNKCCKVIGLHAQNMLIIFGSTVNIIYLFFRVGEGGGGFYDILIIKTISTLRINKIVLHAPGNYEQNDYIKGLDLLTILH